MSCVSLHGHRFTFGIRWYAAEALLPTVFENQSNGGGKARAGFFLRPPLAIGPWNLRTVRHNPVTIPLEHGGEFLMHREPRLYSSVVEGPLSNRRLERRALSGGAGQFLAVSCRAMALSYGPP